MKTSYIYSSSRVKALEKELLNEASVNHLLESAKGEAFMKALKETYLATHLKSENADGVFSALEDSLVEAKNLIERVAPEKRLFDFLWVRYDLHNLRVILKAKKAGLSEDKMSPYLSRLGKYTPETLQEHISAGTLNRLESEFKVIYEQAEKIMEEQGVATADLLIDTSYFELAKRMVHDTHDLSLGKVIRLQIDLYNLRTKLRTLLVEREDSSAWFVTGGNLRLSDIDSKEQALSALLAYGGEKYWREAIEVYNTEQHLTLIEARADDFLLETLRDMSHDIFSPASLIAYFLQTQNSAKIIQTITVGKESGQDESQIRKHLRTLYV